MSSCLCVDSKQGKDQPLTDKSLGKSKQKNLPVHTLVHLIRVLQMLILVKNKKDSGGGSKWGSSPNKPLFWWTCKEPVGKYKKPFDKK